MGTIINNHENQFDEQVRTRIEECIDIQMKDITFFTKRWDQVNLYESYENIEKKDNNFVFQKKSGPFKKFVIVVTNFPSLSFTNILNEIFHLIEKAKTSIKCLMENVKENRNITNELIDVFNLFDKTVLNINHKTSTMFLFLETAMRHIIVIEKVLNSNQCDDAEWSNADKIDIRIALKGLTKGPKKLLKLSKSTKRYMEEARPNQNNFCGTSKETVTKLCEEFLVKKCCISSKHISDQVDCGTAQNFVSFLSYRFWVLFTFTKNFVSNYYISKLWHYIAYPIGFLMYSTKKKPQGSHKLNGVIPPMIGVIGAYVLGECSQSVINLVKELWNLEQQKDLYELNKLIESLVQLDSASKKIMYCMADAEEITLKVLSNIEIIQACLENKNQQAENRKICSSSIQSTKIIIESLRKISFVSQKTSLPF